MAALTGRHTASGWGRGPGTPASGPLGSLGGTAPRLLGDVLCSTAWMWWTRPPVLEPDDQIHHKPPYYYTTCVKQKRLCWETKFHLPLPEFVLQGFTYLHLITVDGGTVNVTISCLQGPNDCLFHLWTSHTGWERNYNMEGLLTQNCEKRISPQQGKK